MAKDGTKDIIKYLKKFGGRTAEYSEWKYHTRRTIGLYKPDICKLLSGTWSKPDTQFDTTPDEHDHGEGIHDDDEEEHENINEDENQKDPDTGDAPEVEQIRKDIADAEDKAKTAALDVEEAKDVLRGVLNVPNLRSKLWNIRLETSPALCKRLRCLFFFLHTHRLLTATTMARTTHTHFSEVHKAQPTLNLPRTCRIACFAALRPATQSSQAMDADTTLLVFCWKTPKCTRHLALSRSQVASRPRRHAI